VNGTERRWHRIVLAAIMIAGSTTLHGPLGAQEPVPQAPQVAEQAEAIEIDRAAAKAESLAAAVKVMLRFRDYPDLTGEYRVNADSTVSIPVIGRVPVAGVSAAELEQILADRVTEITGGQSYVTVEVVEYRPVFVTGSVNLSGASPWQPGMTVLQAVAVSGGVARPMALGNAAQLGSDPGRLAKALDDKKRLLAAVALIRAELTDDEQVEIPRELVAIAGQEEAERMIAAQNALLERRRGTLEAELAAIERGRTLAANELEGLTSQAESVAEQLGLRRQNSARIEDLRKRGLAVADRSIEQELKVLELEEKATNTSVALARVRSTIAGLERDEITLKQRRNAELDQQLMRLERDLAQISLEAEAAILSGSPMPATLGLGGPPPEPRYRVTRTEDGGSSIFDAEESTPLWPGDVLVVTMEPVSASSSAVTDEQEAQEARSRP
jgi:protein involved in polysaccharide export with SLBB domain